jgi:hypothetical protein
VTFTPRPRSTDWDVILDAVYDTLAANTFISTTLALGSNPRRIAQRTAQEGVEPPYIVLAFTPTTRNSSYGRPGVNGLLDVSCYTRGWSTTMVRALIKACIAALFDGAWITTALDAEGVRLLDASLAADGTGIRDIDEVIAGAMVRGKQLTGRIWADKA